MTRRIVLLFVALLLFLTGCGGADFMTAGAAPQAPAERSARTEAGFAGSDDGLPYPPEPSMLAEAEVDANVTGGAPPPPPAQPAPAPPTPDATAPPQVKKQAQPLLIYTADYTMAVFETTAATDEVQKMAEELGGYLVKRTDGTITERVPSNTFKQALGKLEGLGDVLHRDESVEDVTEAFYDLKTRLENARAMRDRLEELLAQAKDVKEALAVERELARITADIETMEGKLKRLRELIAFSTITVRFEARGGETVGDEVRLPFPWLDQLGLSNLLQM
jgi:hypothetical protein